MRRTFAICIMYCLSPGNIQALQMRSYVPVHRIELSLGQMFCKTQLGLMLCREHSAESFDICPT